MNFSVQVERESDGRWIAEVGELPGVLVYGQSAREAQAKAQDQFLSLRTNATRHHGRVPRLGACCGRRRKSGSSAC